MHRCYYYITLVIIVHDWEHNVDMDAKVHRHVYCRLSSESFCLTRRWEMVMIKLKNNMK